MRQFSSFVTFALPLAAALPWDGPQPTQEAAGSAVGVMTGWTPKPTSVEPDYQFYMDHDLVALELRKRKLELEKRQAQSSVAGSSATTTHATCGFLDGSTSNAFTCNSPDASCAYDGVHSVFGCCGNPSNCIMPTSCIPQASLTNCDDQCAANSYIAKCASSSAFCNYNLLLGGGGVSAYAWYCDITPGIVTLSVTATDGDQGVVSYAQVVMSIPPQDLTTTTSTPSSTPGTTTSPSTTIPGTTTITPTPTPTPNPTPAPAKKSNTGAIAGGVVGGVAALAIVAFLIWFFAFHRGKKNGPETTQQAAPVNQGYTAPPMNHQSSVAGGAAYYGQGAPPEKEVYNATSTQQYPTGENRPMSQELYSPSHSPIPPYTGGPAVAHGGNQYPYPNVAEVDGTSAQMTHNAGPGTY